MDEKEQNDTNKSTGAPVMDIQPPRPSQVPNTGDDDMPSLTDESVSSPSPQPETPAPAPEPAPAPASDKPNLSTPELPAHAGKKAPVLAITLLIAIALGLAAGAVYLYLKTVEITVNTQETSANTQTQPETEVTPEEVDETAKEVDEAVNGLNDTQDLNANDLSDSTLGL